MSCGPEASRDCTATKQIIVRPGDDDSHHDDQPRHRHNHGCRTRFLHERATNLSGEPRDIGFVVPIIERARLELAGHLAPGFATNRDVGMRDQHFDRGVVVVLDGITRDDPCRIATRPQLGMIEPVAPTCDRGRIVGGRRVYVRR